MEQADVLRLVVETLEQLGVRYFVTGSWATIYYSEPRLTNDIDIVADLGLQHVRPFAAAVERLGFYVSEDAVRDAVINRFQFNIINNQTMMKVDIIVPDREPHSQAELARARRVEALPGLLAKYAAIEDVILKKLVFYRDGQSTKHLRDIASVLRVNQAPLDMAYLDDWAARLGVADIWQAVRAKSPPSP